MKRMNRISGMLLVFAASFFLIFAVSMQNTSSVSIKEGEMADSGECEHFFPDDYIVISEANCSAKGMKYRSCIICSAKDIVETPKNPDVHSSPASFWTYDPAPTCAQGGIQFHICLDCNGKVDVTEIPPNPDNHVANGDYVIVKAATCTTEGEKAYQCKYCNQYFNNQPIEINPRAHVTSDNSKWQVISFPTCSESGSMKCFCDNCNQVALTKTIPPTEQHEAEPFFTIDVPATCVSDGLKSQHCTECDAHLNTEVIPATPDVHTFNQAFIVDKAPTCSDEGEESRHCYYCDEKCDIRAVAPNERNHVYNDEWIITRAATCSEMGLMHQVCTLCGEPSVSTIIPKTEHQYGDYELIKMSADNLSAQVKYVCAACGDEYMTIVTFEENNPGGNIGDEPDLKIHKIIPNDDTLYIVDHEALLISNIARDTSYEKFLSNFKNGSSFVMYNKNNVFVDEGDFVATGYRLNYAPIGEAPTNYLISVLGDVNSDGRVTSADARLILRASAKLETLANAYFVAADVDGNGKITASDARKTLRVSAFLTYFESTYKQ